MPTNRNDKVGKEFAIGTIIKYNGKLYEVVKHKDCDNCSIKSFCDASDEYIPTSVVPRDKLISIFGKCSAIDRDDNTSVVFVEVPKDNSKDNVNDKYHKIIPLFRDDNPSKLKSIKFDLPNGYVIDEYNSDLDKGIIRFKREWLTLEQLYNSLTENNISQYRNNCISFSPNKLLDIAKFMDIARYFNGNWEYNVTKEDVGYAIAYYKFVEEPHYSVCKIENSVYTYYGNPVFKNEADAQYVIDNPNFRDVLDNIFKS